jgi:3-hydroxybutyryl-CoA dehydrogenase
MPNGRRHRVQIDEVRRVAIVGAGTMGQQIGFQCAGHGFEVVLYDTAPAALQAATERIDSYAAGLVADGTITAAVLQSAQGRITSTTNLATAAAEADVLVEAVPEDPKLKRRVLAEFDSLCPPRTISQPTPPPCCRHSSPGRPSAQSG